MSLAQVLQMLKQALQRKSLLLESNQQVAQAASALRNQTEIIQRISKEITLLSLNASIEAARAGEAGRGFSVVAERVRELSDTTSQAANDIISRMQTLMQAIDGSSSQLLSNGELDEQLMADANRQIGAVLSGFNLMTTELCGTIGQLEQTQLQVQHKLEDAIRNFQFQDRVSQRLTHVISAMQQLTHECMQVADQMWAVGLAGAAEIPGVIVAMYIIDMELIGRIRWEPQYYWSDGIFIEKIATTWPERHRFIDFIGAYYNALA
jgi:methyl-accepting chemotaxis protein